MEQAAARKLTMGQHLEELQRRLIVVVAILGVGGCVGYILREPVIKWLQAPLHSQLFYTSPMGSFQFIMQVCLLTGVLVALPAIIYNLISFVKPALPQKLSMKLVWGMVIASFALALAGAAFGYYVGLPIALHFFSTVGGGQLTPLITADRYMSFITGYLGIFVVIFQLPLLLLIANYISPLPPRKLVSWRKYVIIGSFAVNIINPAAGDPLSQAIFALPMIILYEISILLIRISNLRNRLTQKKIEELSPVVEVVPQPVITPQSKRAYRDLQPVGRSRGQAAHVLDLRTAKQ